jgi:hypothetical protein
MSERYGLLRNRVILLLVLCASLYGSVVSWLSVSGPLGPHREGYTVILMFGLACAIFITASIALRSKSLGDRAVFGAFAGALALAAVSLAVPLGSRTLFAVIVAKALLWTAAALASVTVLVRSLGVSRTV